MRKSSGLIALLLLTNAGCRAPTRNLAKDVVPTTNVYDGFEQPRLSSVWETSRFAPGAVTMERQTVRAGRQAAKVTVHSGDEFETGLHGSLDSERAELLEARRLVARQNAGYEYTFSMFFPASFPIVSTRLVIAQWKQYCVNNGPCSDDSPVLALRYIGGALWITQDLDHEHVVLYKHAGEYRNRWLDFKVQSRFATDATGRIRVWLQGEQLVDKRGLTADSENAETGYPEPSRFYFKMGLYRDVMKPPMSVYIDEYRKRQLGANEF